MSRFAALGGACALAFVLAAPFAAQAQAQTWCAEYRDGSRACGIPTEQSCLASIAGVGGDCAPDLDNRPPVGPRIIQRQFDPGAPLPPPGSNNLPGSDPRDMPPPPVR